MLPWRGLKLRLSEAQHCVSSVFSSSLNSAQFEFHLQPPSALQMAVPDPSRRQHESFLSAQCHCRWTEGLDGDYRVLDAVNWLRIKL